MRILIAGEYAWPWYEEACARALEKQGCEVVRFGWLERFKQWVPPATEPAYRSFGHRLQFRLLDGPLVREVNGDLVATVASRRPDVVWFYNVQLIHAATVRKVRKAVPGAVLSQYANDNPFSSRARASMWRHFRRSIPLFDLHHVYREANVQDFISSGARDVRLLRSYFLPEVDTPLPREAIDPRYSCDVVFAGHYEDDARVEALEAVCRAGYKLNLFGGGWGRALSRLAPDSPLRALYPISPVTGRDYTQAVCGAKVALCFLSSLNEDTYTRRSFQIPAMRVAMLSQRSEDLLRLFQDGKEAVFFSTTDELLQQLRFLLDNESARLCIARAGYARVYADGHDVDSRMKQWLADVRAVGS